VRQSELAALTRLRDRLRRDGYGELQFVPFAAHAPDYCARHLDVLLDEEKTLLARRACNEPILYMYSLCPAYYGRHLTDRLRLLAELFLHNRAVAAATVRRELPEYFDDIATVCGACDPIVCPIRCVPLADFICIADPIDARHESHVFLHNDSVQMARYLLESRRLAERVVADVGTGSGVLALSAARAGAARVIATDINPRCLDFARATFQLNGESDIELRSGSIDCVVGEADVIVANPPYMLGQSALALDGGGRYGLDTALMYVSTALAHGREILMVLDLPEHIGALFLREVGASPAVKQVLRRRPGYDLTVYEFRPDSKGIPA